MNRPAPQVGQIVRFDYLWRDEALAGQAQGAKDRPCAVVVARRTESDGSHVVLLAPITHSAPNDNVAAIALPTSSAARAMTGLDDDRSWLIVAEVNFVAWSDPGFVPIAKDRWSYGHLPRTIAEQASATIADRLRVGRKKIVKR